MEEPIATYEKARWNKRIGTVRVYDNRVEEPWLTSWDTTAVQELSGMPSAGAHHRASSGSMPFFMQSYR